MVTLKKNNQNKGIAYFFVSINYILFKNVSVSTLSA